MHIGKEPDSGLINRAYWSFSAAIFADQHIYRAHFNTNEVYSYSCTARIVDVYTSDTWGSSLTWNNKPPIAGSYANANVAKGYSASCPGGALGFDVTTLIRALAGQNRPTFDLVLKARDEGDVFAWKKVNFTTNLEVVFNSFPSVPTAMQFTKPVAACGGYPGPAVNNYVQDLKLTSAVTDVDNQGVDVHINVVHASSNVNALPPATYPAGFLSTGAFNANGPQTVTVLHNSLAEGAYAWYGYASDGIDVSAQSAICYFTVDNTPPPPPTVNLAGQAPGAVGKPVSVRFSAAPADHIARFEYWWVPTAKPVTPVAVPVSVMGGPVPVCGANTGTVSFACPDGAGNATVSVAPPDSPATLWVASIDAALNISVATGYQFWAPGDFAAFSRGHSWPTDVGPWALTNMQVADSSTNAASPCNYVCGQPLVLQGGAAGDSANPAQGDPSLTGSLKLNGTTGTGALASTTSPMVDTSKAFSVSAWVRPAAWGTYQTAVSQDPGGSLLVSGFYLQASSANHWRFCLPTTLSGSFVGDCATDPAVASTTNWAFLTGVWDPANHQVRLYVNGALVNTVSHASVPVSSGALVVGRAIGATDLNWFHGWIGDVSVVPGVVDSVQQNFLRLQCPVTNLLCRTLPGD